MPSICILTRVGARYLQRTHPGVKNRISRDMVGVTRVHRGIDYIFYMLRSNLERRSSGEPPAKKCRREAHEQRRNKKQKQKTSKETQINAARRKQQPEGERRKKEETKRARKNRI